MAKDPNKIYLPNGSEAKKVDKNAAYKASRERLLAQREKYKSTPSVPQTAKEKANAAKPGRVSGATVTAAKKAKRVAQTAATKPKVTPKPKVVKPKPLYSVKPKPNKNWRTAPSDADVIIQGYNDPATIKKMEAAARAKKKTAAQKKKGM